MAKVAPLEQVGDPTESHHSGHGGSVTEGRNSLVHVAVNEWRHFMHWSGWYDSAMAVSMRRFLRGKSFAVVTMFALFIALFFADLCIICQLETNMVADVTLTIVFLVFAFEFFGLALTDASYLFSFFFWMDLLGTVSMIFDISFMLGTSATKAETYSGQRGDENLIVVRAARATKLGARAGRLSRVMKLLRFLPFVNNSDQDSDVKMARVISNQLTNVLSTRVAFLTICIVVFLPIFHMFTYPEVDDSMSAWTQLLSANAEEYANATPGTKAWEGARERLNIELERFAAFYSEVSYGPFAVCYGKKNGDDFTCQHGVLDMTFKSDFKEPGRKGSVREINENSFQTSFDLSTPRQLEAVAGVGLICFIIIVMVVFGLVTSSSISVIALQPLERMLSVVRQRCKQIFKYTNDLQDEDSDAEEDEEYDDTEQASEFVLLEKVVSKLAAIAHLSTTKDEPEMKEGMTENEVMVLNWMQGTQVPVHKKGPSLGRFSSSASGPHEITEGSEHVVESPREQSMVQSTLHTVTSDIAEALDSPNFNSLDLSKELKLSVAAYVVLSLDACSVWVRTTVQENHLFKFVSNCEAKYQANPFHNFSHALDVQYSVSYFMSLIQAERFLPESSMFWLMIAAVAHDLGHLGVNNQYLVETSHELALKYNDRSPLENMHCATLFQVVSDPEANVFAQVEKDLYKEMRKGIINAILHTDVTKHNEMMKELSLLYQMNSEAFDELNLESPAVVEVLQSNTQLALNAMLHCADVGNPMKPWSIAERIAYLCIDEFFAQGDLEKAAGIPVQMLNDRDKVNRPNSQIGFIEFVIAPMVEAVVHLFPPLDGLAENLGVNIQNWFNVWVEQTKPAADSESKTQARVQKVTARCQAVMRPDKAHGSVIVHD